MMKHFRAAALLAAGGCADCKRGRICCLSAAGAARRQDDCHVLCELYFQRGIRSVQRDDRYLQSDAGRRGQRMGEQIRCDGRDLDEQPHQHAPMV